MFRQHIFLCAVLLAHLVSLHFAEAAANEVCTENSGKSGSALIASSFQLQSVQQAAAMAKAARKAEIDPASGAWDKNDAQGGHVYSLCLSKALNSILAKRGTKTALDLGAGTGHYTAAMIATGIDTQCFDGNPATNEVTARLCKTLDLASPMAQSAGAPKPADFVWSFEVGEHIPKEKEQVFIDNLAGLAQKGMALSWAVEGQSGLGHVNERNNDYVISELAKRGFVHDANASNALRTEANAPGCCCGWFKNTLMIFNRKSR